MSEEIAAMRARLRGLATDRPRIQRTVVAERVDPDSETARRLRAVQEQLRALAALGRQAGAEEGDGDGGDR